MGMKEKLSILNTIAVWVLVVVIVIWLCFKGDDNKLNNETIKNLTTAVERFSIASENMSNAAKSQREWAMALQESINSKDTMRNGAYGNLFDKYGYDSKVTGSSLSDLYNDRLQQSTKGNSSTDLRGDEDGAGKTGTLQNPVSKPKGQSN